MTTSTSRRSSSRTVVHVPTTGGSVHVVVTDRADGSFHRDLVPPEELERRRRAVVALPWVLLDEVHGTDVVELDRADRREHVDGARGDVLATSLPDHVVGVWVGDCAPVVLVRGDGRIVVAHAGWRGLAAGVLDAAVRSLLDAPPVQVEDQRETDLVDATDVDEPGAVAVLGPCIGPCCYEFGVEDLDRVADELGVPITDVVGRDRHGRPALDVPRAVRAVLTRHGIPLRDLAVCTGCDERFYSHRVRRDTGRHVVAAWREAS